MSHEEDITSVVVTLDNERDCTRAVRALRRQYPTAKDMPIFVRAVDEQVCGKEGDALDAQARTVNTRNAPKTVQTPLERPDDLRHQHP
eukprot:scaffold145645_cov32-Tisochrysis_lutea.AAC.3